MLGTVSFEMQVPVDTDPEAVKEWIIQIVHNFPLQNFRLQQGKGRTTMLDNTVVVTIQPDPLGLEKAE